MKQQQTKGKIINSIHIDWPLLYETKIQKALQALSAVPKLLNPLLRDYGESLQEWIETPKVLSYLNEGMARMAVLKTDDASAESEQVIPLLECVRVS